MEQKPRVSQTLLRERRIGSFARAENLFESFSITEKVLFLIAAIILAGSAFSLVAKASAQFSVSIPHKGGELVEGIAGTPRFINPLLAVSDADRDLTTLVYSGLLKATPDGSYVPDLAESYEVSPDGRTYSFTIRRDAIFHDGKPVTAEDVKFTVERAQDPALKSPRRVAWEGVVVEKIDSRNITFTLKQPYAPFIASLTMGILPKHIWSGLESDQMTFSAKNIQAVGSGPYEIDSVTRTDEGIPSKMSLRAFKSYSLGEPNITSLVLKFYSNEKALAAALMNREIESAPSLSPASAESLDDANVMSAPLTRVFGIFFNQNENEVLAHKEVRKALDLSIQKDMLIDGVLLGYGSKATGPLPPTVAEAAIEAEENATSSIDDATELLLKAKWKKNPEGIFELKGKSGASTLSLSLATANIPELVEAARRIEEDWRALGAQVDVRVFEPADLNQGVIRPRKYDALLFGIVTGRNADLYPFWHSSQRNDPGLNISLYTNSKADRYLERMRSSTSTEVIMSEYAKLKEEIDKDTPAIFLWSPDFIYALPDKLHGVELGEITTPSDRFIGIEKWYVETDEVWDIFVKDKEKILKN